MTDAHIPDVTEKLTVELAGTTGHIVLDRPEALNALDLDMIAGIHATLTAWKNDDAVTGVLVTSASDRAFCAGGDIRSIREVVVAGDPADAEEYFVREYEMNADIASFGKPYVSLIHGAAMGGGLGVSVHGTARVVTDKLLMAMPETAIGFIPDIGSSYFLQQVRGADGQASPAVGLFLALTGRRLDAADALVLGLATHAVRADERQRFVEVARAEGVEVALRDVAVGADDPAVGQIVGESTLAPYLAQIAQVFGLDSVEAILAELRRGDVDPGWAVPAVVALETVSPTALLATFELMRTSAGLSLRECLDNELRIGAWVCAQPDFPEGVRAVLVDKDQDPRWSPATFGEVDLGAVR